jgi:hypothetical protein
LEARCFYKEKEHAIIQSLMDGDENNDIASGHVKVFHVLLVELMDLLCII